MDALFLGPGWVPIPTFVDDVERIVAGEEWVFDSYGYESVRDLVWSRAHAVVWLDYSRAVVLNRVVRRSARRTWGNEQIFNGNVERLGEWRKPYHPVQWSMRRYDKAKFEMETRFADPEYAHIAKVRVRRPAAAEWWLDYAAGGR